MNVKILHTSDWHLGKKLFRRSRIEEQRSFLNWLEQEVIDREINFLIIAGDIFDTPTPPNDALDLYFNFLESLSNKADVDIIIISGNHDSANFIQAPASILKKHNIHIKTRISTDTPQNHITITKDDQTFCFKCIPYFRSYEIYPFIKDDQTKELEGADVKEALGQIAKWPSDLNKTNSSVFKCIIAHHAFGDFAATGSEHLVSVMGIENLKLNWLGEDFDYFALGHIHKTQKMSSTKDIYYSGSPIPMRFSERQKKNVIEISVDKNSHTTELIEVPSFKEIVQISSNEKEIQNILEEKLKALDENKVVDAYFEIKLALLGPNNELTNRLYEEVSSRGHHLLSLIPTYSSKDESIESAIDINQVSLTSLFDLYYKEKYPEQETPKDIQDEFKNLLEELNSEIS